MRGMDTKSKASSTADRFGDYFIGKVTKAKPTPVPVKPIKK